MLSLALSVEACKFYSTSEISHKNTGSRKRFKVLNEGTRKRAYLPLPLSFHIFQMNLNGIGSASKFFKALENISKNISSACSTNIFVFFSLS